MPHDEEWVVVGGAGYGTPGKNPHMNEPGYFLACIDRQRQLQEKLARILEVKMRERAVERRKEERVVLRQPIEECE